MKVVFWGLGSIGKRHVEILKKDFSHELFAYRNRSRKKIRNHGLGIKEIYDWQELDRVKPHVAFITNPTFLHIDTAIECARKGMNLFIEKPLDSQVIHLNRLLKIVSSKKLTTYVAYVLRFHPVINQLKGYVKRYRFLHMRVVTSSYLPSWRPDGDPHKSYSANSKMGGGVLYDLSHELDYTQYLLGDIKKLNGQFGRRSQVTVDAEDYADILAETEKGPVNIHIDFLSQMNQRNVQIDFKEAAVVGDLINNTVFEYKNGRVAKKFIFKDGYADCYRRQLKYFFANLRNQRMMNNVFEASDLFKKIYAFKKNKGFYG